MKRVLRIILSVVLALALLVSIGWYFLQYDRDFTRDIMLSIARSLDEKGNRSLSDRFYDLAYRYAGNDDAIAIELARQHRLNGNYTKAEYTLSNAIADGASAELYIALCKTYVEQDKLLDAITMLDTISDPAIKEQLDAMRPQIPKANPEQGHYNSYISVTLTSPDSKIYYTLNGDYPSTDGNLFAKPFRLDGGQATIRAISIADNGLVSPLVVLDYTVTGVIEPVQFQDPAIEKAIRQQLGVDEDHVIHSNELWNIEYFIVPAQAKTLSDLSKLPFLKELSVKGGKVENLLPLQSLLSLETLIVSDIILSSADMEAIGSMTTLKKLSLSNCSVATMDAFKQLTDLTHLDISSNTIRDLDVISTYKNLEFLDLSHNAVTDLTLLGGLNKLAALDLSFNSVTDISPLSGCISLSVLNVNNNQLTALTGLEKLSGLQSLSAAFNKLENVDNLAANVTLSILDISNNAIRDITALSPLNQLTSFNFSYNQISALPAFSKNCALVAIKGSKNNLSSLEALDGLENLNYVIMDHNAAISSLAPLINCHLLVEVSVYGTAVKDVTALREMNVIVKYSPV